MQVLHPPFYEGLSFTIMCAEGLFSATGVDFSTVSVTSEGWEFQDPDFSCGPGKHETVILCDVFKRTTGWNLFL